MKKVVRVVVVVAVLAAVGLFVRSRLNHQEDPNRLAVSGNIEMTEVDISFKMPGRVVELNVREGDQVRKGAVIARLDQESPLRQKDREEAGLEAAQAQLAQMRTAIEFQEATIEGDLALRKAEVRAAEARLEELEAGSRPQEVESAKAALSDARTWQQQAQRDWDRAQTLYKVEDISAQQYEQFRSKFESMSQALRQAQERYDLVREGPRKQTIEAARAQLERAKAAVRLAEASRIELRRKRQELEVRKAEINRAQAGIAIINAQLNDTVVESPVDGVVMVKSAEEGEVIAAGATLVTIGDIAHPWLRAYIPEKALGRVKLGSKVRLTTDSYPGKEYWGKVTFIASEAEFTPKQIQTEDERTKLVYRIKVEVDNPNQELKSNMPVDAEIVL